jgi:serine/threonine protein phosphatase PrpC
MKDDRTGAWRVVGASVAGSAHLLHGLPCQDRHVVKVMPDAAGTDILLVAVADGASFAKCADAGADIAVEGFLNRVQNAIAARPFAHVSVVDCRDWLLATRQLLLDAAAADGLLPRDLAATFAAAVVAPDAAFALQIGDGIIAAQTAGDRPWHIAFWPQKGEYYNETRFLTDQDATSHVLVSRLEVGITRLAVCSDGLEALCLIRAERAVFSPFFDEIARTVLAVPDESANELNPALERYLGSDAVNDVTDDDKTLVLAARRPEA